MKTELKIVRHFIGNKKPKTIREIAKQIKADYRITYTAVQRLIEKKVLKVQTVGKSSLCELNEKCYCIEIYEAENERRENILKNKNINQLYKEIMSKVKTSLFTLLLFGSYSKGKQTTSSDIDILFISNESNFEPKISDILSLIPLNTHVLVFTEEEFIRMKDSKTSNVIQEAIENNIILYGIETYYKLKNA
ncbi:nucleotidyltransferase domain-containing protein [Candidatus Woesearchaeota archaeon]|nr:nucleotidyltransferase domain-containing protein [Candidatus Woesearchaeota archaeon]